MRLRASLRTGVMITLLAACSDVKPIQLGEPTNASAGARSMSWDADATLPTTDRGDDPGTDTAQTDPSPLDAGAMAPPTSQPGAADAGAHPANTPDARIDDNDLDDDDDEDSEESPEPERSRDEEDAGEPSGD